VHPGANFDIGPIQRARSDCQKRLRRIRRLADQEPSERRSRLLDRECQEYARSPLVRRAILSSLPQFHRWEHERLRALVDDLNPLTRCDADVIWRVDQKSTGGDRPVCCKLPAQVHLGQVIGKGLITAHLRPDPRVFDWRRRGRLRYADALARALEHEGPFVATMDIKSCHQSIDPDALYRLNLLPAELLRWSIDYRNLSFRPLEVENLTSTHILPVKPIGPRGLLQGGPASSALLTALIGHSATAVRQAYCQNYSDNFALVGRTTAVVQQAAGELARIVAECRAGRLEFHPYQVVDARDGFEQLGFNFILIGGRARISPNTGNTINLLRRIEERIALADDSDLALCPAAFLAEEAVAYRVLTDLDLSEVEEAVESMWLEQLDRRGVQPETSRTIRLLP
jgi:hypothetical protein